MILLDASSWVWMSTLHELIMIQLTILYQKPGLQYTSRPFAVPREPVSKRGILFRPLMSHSKVTLSLSRGPTGMTTLSSSRRYTPSLA